MKLNSSYQTEKHNGYTFITLKNDNLEVVLSDLGASIYSIKFHDDLMTLTPSNKDEFFHSNLYHGKTIGRVSNRLKGNKVKIGDAEYEIANNEGENTLHGGENGLSTQKFSYEIVQHQNTLKVVFTLLDKETVPGFPGDLFVTVTYQLLNNSLKIILKAKSNKLTMCSLTNHTYYSLGTNSLDELKLSIKAHHYLEPNADNLLPLSINKINKIMDFTSLRKITTYIDVPYLMNSKTKGYDHYYYFDNDTSKKSQTKLVGPKYKLKVYTDYPGVQIYSDNYPTKEAFKQSNKDIRRGIAIEPSQSQANYHYLDKDEEYSHFIKLVFSEVK